MRIKTFTKKSEFWRGAVAISELENEVNAWLQANPNITISEVKHDVLSSFWTYTQLVISLYYAEATATRSSPFGAGSSDA